MTVRHYFCVIAAVVGVILVATVMGWPGLWWLFLIYLPVVAVGIRDMLQKSHSLLRLYPVIGHFRYLFESVRPEIQQYFVESDTNGKPMSREFRSLVYQRAKGARDTRPFGTIFDVYQQGYEWLNHSISPREVMAEAPRVEFGGGNCRKPYAMAMVNVSAMSYGSLSQNAVRALNGGAKLGGFAQNTGEGGLSPYHLEQGGDLVWQIGTGYFGCRDSNGDFDGESFAQRASNDAVKMIEIKLSQGAKPGHGGILPAAKVTEEISLIRGVPMGQDVNSPAGHSAFADPQGLLRFVEQLRELSGGKPVGFKLCVGNKAEFISICKAMLESGITPDFITVDGAEGGTGAAPVEFTNSVGMPLRDALAFVDDALRGCGLRQQIRLIASGKVMSAFHAIRLLALGADTVNVARAMMFALGCIQSRSCNTDHCPTGIATQNPTRMAALDVTDKRQRVYNYQHKLVHQMMDLIAAAGLRGFDELSRHHINRRASAGNAQSYAEVYPPLAEGSLLAKELPAAWQDMWQRATPSSWGAV